MAGKHGDQRAIPDDALPDDYRLLADSPNYLVAASIPEGQDLILRIVGLGSGEVIGDGGRVSVKGLVYFQGHERPMILNKRRGGILERLYGENPKGWIGKWVALYRGKDRGEGGRQVPAVAIRQRNPEPAPLTDDQQRVVGDLVERIRAADSVAVLEAVIAPHRDAIAGMGIRAISAIADAKMRRTTALADAAAAAIAAAEAARESTREGGSDGKSS